MRSQFKASKTKGHFEVNGLVTEDDILAMATRIVRKRFKRGKPLSSPEETREYLKLMLSHFEHEVFCAIFMDNRHRVLAFEELFQGTISGSSVHPREVVKKAMKVNAAALIFVHNHPSGVAEPSESDGEITQQLKKALALVEVRVLDHIVVGGTGVVSMAERGLC